MHDILVKDPDFAHLLGIKPGIPVSGDSATVGGAYDGAARFGRELASWAPALRSADRDILPEKPLIDARTQDTLRNDAYVAGGGELHRDNIVGGMFLLNSKPEHKILGMDETWGEEFQEEIEAKFTLAMESTNNWIDAARVLNFTGMVRMAVLESLKGEVLSSVEWLRDYDRPFNTAIQMLDTSRLCNPYFGMDTPRLRGGIERNQFGAPMGYHILQAHPTDWDNAGAYTWKYVPARKPWGRPQIIHIYDQLRPDQTRGIPAMVSALKEMKMTKRFKDIVLQNAVVNATYAASIESDMPPEAVFAALGGGAAPKAVREYAGAWLGAIAEYTQGANHLSIDGVKIPHLFPGTKLQLRPAGQGGPLGTEFEQSLLRYIAANLGVSYEQLSRDYSRTNYSSIRAAMTETWKYMQARKKMCADRFASIIYRLWFEEMFNKGEFECLKTRRAPSIYEGLNMEAYTACEWIGASRGQIDELKETQAAVLRLKYNLSTREDEMARLGKDWRKVLIQLEREKKEMDARGLTPDPQDNMINAVTGAPREKEAKDEKDDGSEDNTDE